MTSLAVTPRRSRLFLETFGCQMNFLDSEFLHGQFEKAEYDIVGRSEDADVICFNTCAVRDHAEGRVRSRLGALREAKRERPGLVIAVIGCMAQREGKALLRSWPHLDIVCGTREFHKLPMFVERVRQDHDRLLALGDDDVMSMPRDIEVRPRKAQAFVAIMRGCDKACSFCIVPTVRGREQHKPFDEVVAEVDALVSDGVREVTLLGQTVNNYGKHLEPRRSFGDLLRRLDEIRDLKRLRFITSFPSLMTDDTIDAMAECSSVSRYLHLPVQSGSNRMLRAMRRGYTVERYLDLVDKLRSKVSGIELATDIIVGFPGETEEDTAATEELLRRIRFVQAFIFKYSPRPKTDSAERLEDDVPHDVKKRRNTHLLDVQEAIQAEKNQALVGRKTVALVEGTSKRDAHRLTGRSDENRIVHFEGGDLVGRFVEVEIEQATGLSLSGKLVRILEDADVPRPGHP